MAVSYEDLKTIDSARKELVSAIEKVLHKDKFSSIAVLKDPNFIADVAREAFGATPAPSPRSDASKAPAKPKAKPKSRKTFSLDERKRLLADWVKDEGKAGDPLKLESFTKRLRAIGVTSQPKQWLKPLKLAEKTVFARVDKKKPAEGTYFYWEKVDWLKEG